MGIQMRRQYPSPNVAIASGEVYPNGVDISPANPSVQATVRPVGWMFRSSPGYVGVRVGNHKLDLNHPQGYGIHFTPIRLAEDIAAPGLPAMIDTTNGPDHADLADVPGSEFLDGQGKLPGALAATNAGPYLAESATTGPVGDVPRTGGNTPMDPTGARSQVVRDVTTRAFYDRLLMNPNVVLKQEWQADPVITTLWAAVVIGGLSMLAHNIERGFRGRRARGVAVVASVPAAAAAGSGKTVADTTKVANEALTNAGAAVQTAVSAAGDAVEAAGDAVEKTTDAAAAATT